MKKITLLLTLIIMFLMASCAFAVDLLPGKEYFLKTPLYAERDKDEIDWVNYSDMRVRLKAGEKLTVIEIKGHIVKFILNNRIYSFTFTQKGIAASGEIFDKYFSTENVREEIEKNGEKIRNNIMLGKVELGMTKEQVLLAAGCPSIAGSLKTYNLTLNDIKTSDSWIFYRSRLNKWFVQFAEGKVVSVKD